jgi:phospholipid/cholesterol/gamma-HCH transport system substrate-binding protein
MNEQRMRLRIGVFVLGALVVFAVLIILFSSFPVLLKRHQEYTLIFSAAPGVAAGTPVRRSGVPIGEVRDVQLDDSTGTVRVSVLIAAPHTLYEGDQARLVHGLIGGDTAIDFVSAEGPQPPAGRPPLKPGSEVTGTTTPDASKLMAQTSELVPSTQETLNDMRRSMQRFEQMAPHMDEAFREVRDLAKATREIVPELRRTNEEILVTSRNWGKLGERLDVLVQTNQEKLVKTLDNFNDTVQRVGKVFNDENQRNLSRTLQNARAGSENLESISKNTDQLVKESRETIRRVNSSITQTDQVLGNLQQATKPMADRSDRVMRNLDESTIKLNRTLEQADELMRALNREDGTLRRLATDPALYNNLNDLTCLMLRLMPRMDRILHDLEVFADKVARHPESLGLGGVITPSSGLKEAPTSHQWPRH